MEPLARSKDLPPIERRGRVASACLQCQQKKKRCDGKVPQCTTCAERYLTCIYQEVRRRGRGKTKAYLERLESRVAELEASARHAANVPVGSANNTMAWVEEQLAQPAPGTCENTTKSTVSDMGNPFTTVSQNERRHEPIYRESEAGIHDPSIISGGYEGKYSALKEKLFSMFPEQTTRQLRFEANRGPFTSSVFIQLPPKSQLQPMFEVAFTEANYTLPLFDVPVLADLLEQHYSAPTVPPGKHPERWAMLNATIAVAIQLRTARGSYSEMTDLSWHFFKNAFSMYSVIALRAADILGLEALLAMAIYMQGSSDVRTTSVLICAAARLSLIFGLHRREFYSVLDPVATNRHKRAFWVAYILDKSMSIKTGLPSIFDDDAINLDYPDLVMSASLTDGNVPEPSMPTSAFRLQAELVMIEFSVEKTLYSGLTSRQSVPQLLDLAAEFDRQLENWKAKLPSSFQPDRTIWSTMPTAREHIILLHFAYYCTLSEIHGFAAHLNQEGDISTIRHIQSSRIIQASAACQIIHILQFLPCHQPGHLWHILCYPISACITLVAIVLENPTGAQARSLTRYIGHLIEFLTRVQRDKILEVQLLLDLCSEFERLALHAISKAAKGAEISTPPSVSIASDSQVYRQKILCYANGRTSSMQLAHGLMGNIPSLCSIAARTFSGLIPKLQISPSASLLAPSSLNPETYGFTFM